MGSMRERIKEYELGRSRPWGNVIIGDRAERVALGLRTLGTTGMGESIIVFEEMARRSSLLAP